MQSENPVDLERLLPAAVAVAFRTSSFDELQAWLREELGTFVPANSPMQDDAGFARAFSFAFGRALWNGLPIVATGHPPAPVAEPGRNEPCPCGSQKKYKHCCLGTGSMPTFSGEILWPYVLRELPRKERKQLAEGPRIPINAIGAYAVEALKADRAQDAIDMLEPRLSMPERHHDEDTARLVDLLCDAYDAKERTFRRKIEFLESTTRRAPRSPLRSEAWQRLATIYMDEGRHEDAWQAVRSAQRDDPRAPALPLLEVHLLSAERRVDEARERADFWIRTLERDGAGNDPDDRRIEFLKRIRKDPLGTLGDAALNAEGGAARPLVEWLAKHRGRPVPEYPLERLVFAEDAADDDEAGADEEDPNTPPDPDVGREMYELVPPPALRDAERAWGEEFPLGKPFSIHEQPFEPDDVWAPAIEARWMCVLDAHPELFDSLMVLDDLATAVGRHPQAGVHGLDHILYEPLLDRSQAILARAMEAQSSAVLSWREPANRPALRSLVRRFTLCMHSDDRAGARAAAEWLVRVNPNDNHGMRFELVNEYLRSGEDAAALELASKYPDDISPETRFGCVLALFRLQRLSEAEAALRAARSELPKVVPYLLPARIKRLQLSEMGVTVGGDDQAWIYRDQMRSVWQETEGAMEWLKKVARLK